MTLFESSVHKIFITPTFKQLLNDESSILDVAYEVEVANQRLECTTEILKICSITLNNRSFRIDLMHILIYSFGVIISMD